MANTYDTSAYPLGSTNPKVLYNNASNFDDALNSLVQNWIDRFGRNRKTWYGFEQDFYQLLSNSGFETPPLVYVDGSPLTVERPTQVIQRGGNLYSVTLPAEFPVELSGTWSADEPLLTIRGDQSLRADLAASGGSGIVGYGTGTVEDALDGLIPIVGEANAYAFGPIKKNGSDYATVGASITPPLSGFTKTNFDASGNHSAGTVGTLAATVSGGTEPIYLMTLGVTTITSGRIKVKTNGADIFEDQPDGYFFSSAAVTTSGIENNRPIDSTTFYFVVRTFDAAITSVTLETDTTWAGAVSFVNLAPVSPTKFAVGGAGSVDGQRNPVGIKVGAYNRNDMALGDTLTLACFQYDGQPLTPAHNFAAGAQALASLVDGDENTAVGSYCLKYNETSNNTGVGYGAAKLNTKGRELVAVGYKAAFSNVIGSRNSSFGFWANGRNNDGNHNTASGWYAGVFAVSGSFNCYYGSQCGTGNKDGSSNSYFGALAGYANNNGATSYNGQVSVGSESWGWGDGVTLIGYRAKAGTSVGAAAANAVAIGNNSYAGGPSTVSVGYQAGNNDSGNLNTNIGPLAGNYGSPTAYLNATCIGYASVVTGSDQMQLGNANVTPYAFAGLQIRSDARDKADVRETSLGLEFILGLRAVEGRWNLREDYLEREEYEYWEDVEEPQAVDSLGNVTSTQLRRVKRVGVRFKELPNDGSKKRERFHQWFIAQEVKTLCDKLGVDFAGYQDHSVKGGDDRLSLGYTEFIPPIVKAIQQLHSRVADIEMRLARLEG